MPTIKIEKTIELTNEEISDLLVAAFEGGITYWCRKVKFVNPEKYDQMFASHAFPLGAELILHDIYSKDKWILTLDKFMKGVKMEMEKMGYTDADDLMDNHDADTADCIIQFALFDEIVFG